MILSVGIRQRAAVMAAVLVLVLVLGCGKKAPPLAPVIQGNVLAPPAGLTCTLDRNQVILAWTHQADPDTARIPAEGFRVHMATKAPGGCEGCPFIFKPVATIAMPHMTCVVPVRSGIQYYFRVQALGAGSVESAYSKTVSVEPTQ